LGVGGRGAAAVVGAGAGFFQRRLPTFSALSLCFGQRSVPAHFMFRRRFKRERMRSI
jgi:hypothetical protein